MSAFVSLYAANEDDFYLKNTAVNCLSVIEKVLSYIKIYNR